MLVCLRSQPSCHASLKFAGYSNLLNGDILKMSNLKLSQPGVPSSSNYRVKDSDIEKCHFSTLATFNLSLFAVFW